MNRKTPNGQGPTDDDFSDATMIDSLQEGSQSWQSNEAPIDDFNDPSNDPASEGVAHVTEAVEEDDMEGVPQSASTDERQNKKSSNLLPLAAGIGGVLFIGAMLYLQFGSAPTSPLAMLPQKQPSRSAELPAKPQPETTGAVAPTSSLTPVIQANQDTASPLLTSPPATPMEQKGVALPGTNNQPPSTTPPIAATAEPGSAVPEKKPPPNEAASFPPMPSAGLAPAPEQEQASTLLAPFPTQAPQPQPESASPTHAESERAHKLSAQIETLQKELETTQQQLAQANARLQELETRKATTDKQASLSVGGDDGFKSHETSAILLTPKKKKLAALSSSVSSPRKSSRPPSRRKKASADEQVWVLRAATPEEAWVAKGEDSRAIQPVRVGDTLPGVGRVMAIRQDGDRWIVEGTQGIVR